MIVQTINTSGCCPQTIVIGRRGTYDTMQIAFDLSYLVESYGNGVAVLAVKRSQDESAYPAVVTQEDNTLTWTVSETDTYYVGSGECQLMWYVDGGLAKTIIYPMVVMRDILQTAEEPPDGYENWIESLTVLGAETQQNAQNAAQSASDASTAKDDAVTAKEAAEAAQQAAETAVTHYPKIENNYWMVWDVDSQNYVSTGIQAEGEDGYSPEISITTITGGHRVTITDKDHPQGQSFDVMDGQGGGGTSDYSELTNKPKINNVELNGNKTAHDLGLAAQSDIPTVPVQSVNGKTGAVVLSAADVGAKPDSYTAPVSSVNGKTGAVSLGSGDIGFDSAQTYQAGTVGAELSNQSRQLNDETTGLDTKAPVILETASGAIASFDDGADSMPIRKIVCTIVPKQAGSGDPSPDNIRPISGWTGAEISGTGINIWDEEWEVGQYRPNTGEKTDNSNNIRSKNFISCKPNTAYSFVWDGWTAWAEQILFYDANYNFLNERKSFGSLPSTFTTPEDAHYMTFSVGGVSTYNHDISINYPATDTTYHPYTGNQISVTFPDEAGTVYGGTLDVVSGKMVVNKVIQNLSTVNNFGIVDRPQNVGGGKCFLGYVQTPLVKLNVTAAEELYSFGLTGDAYDVAGNRCLAYQTQNRTYFRLGFADPNFITTLEDFNTWKNQQEHFEIVFPLANPIEYTLTAEQVSGILETLYGTNNIWSSTGDTEVEYPCDTKLYIDGKLAELQATILENIGG